MISWPLFKTALDLILKIIAKNKRIEITIIVVNTGSLKIKTDIIATVISTELIILRVEKIITENNTLF